MTKLLPENHSTRRWPSKLAAGSTQRSPMHTVRKKSSAAAGERSTSRHLREQAGRRAGGRAGGRAARQHVSSAAPQGSSDCRPALPGEPWSQQQPVGRHKPTAG